MFVDFKIILISKILVKFSWLVVWFRLPVHSPKLILLNSYRTFNNFQFTNAIKPICLHTKNDDLSEKTATIVGYGDLEYLGEPSKQLMEASVKVKIGWGNLCTWKLWLSNFQIF